MRAEAGAIKAREKVVVAVLRYLSAEHEREDAAHYGDELDYAEEMIALAARELARATWALPHDDRPIGWNAVPCRDEARDIEGATALVAEVERLRTALERIRDYEMYTPEEARLGMKPGARDYTLGEVIAAATLRGAS